MLMVDLLLHSVDYNLITTKTLRIAECAPLVCLCYCVKREKNVVVTEQVCECLVGETKLGLTVLRNKLIISSDSCIIAAFIAIIIMEITVISLALLHHTERWICWCVERHVVQII